MRNHDETPAVSPTRTTSRCQRARRRGAAAVEFAVVVPVLLLLVFGIFEAGRLLMVEQTLSNAARAGAREASLSGTTTTTVLANINSALALASITGHTVTLNPADPSTALPNTPVQVRIAVPFSAVSWVGAMFTTVVLSGQCTMRKED